MNQPTLDVAALQRAAAGRSLIGAAGTTCEVHPSLGSTNDRAAALAREGAAEGSLVVALAQEAGRGRLGRRWASPGGGLYLSLVLRPQEDMLRRLPITLLAGLAVAEAIDQTVPGAAARLKWPNDVVISDRKVAGVLGDLSRDAAGPLLVLGVGVNVATPVEALPDELRATATSLAAVGSPPSLEAFLARFLERFEEAYLSVRNGGGAHLLANASERMPLLGRPVRVRLAEGLLEGKAAGLSATGALVVELADGRREVVMAGEVEEVRPA